MVGLLLSALSYRQERSSRIHWDSLREEPRVTTRILGIPVWMSEEAPSEPFQGAYEEITGWALDPKRWQETSPDFGKTLLRTKNICLSYPFKLRERRALLEAVFAGYRSGVPRAQAAEQIRRIDELLPAPNISPSAVDYGALDVLREELGLPAYRRPEPP